MPFVQRDQAGKIVGLFNRTQIGIPIEELPADNAEVVAFGVPLISLHDRLKAIMLTLPDDVQAQFGVVAAAVDLAVQNHSFNVAKLELQALTLPPELEAIRKQMLQEIANG